MKFMPYVQSDFTCNLDPTSQMKLVIEGNEWTKVVCKFQCKKHASMCMQMGNLYWKCVREYMRENWITRQHSHSL